MTRNLRTIALVCLAIAGCLDGAAPVAKPTAKANVWTTAADRLEAGHWSDSSHRAIKDIVAVAKLTHTPFPPDFDSFWKPYQKKNIPLDATMRKDIATQLRKWGQQ